MGHGNWQQIQNYVRASDRFRFNYFLRSRSTREIKARAEFLMRYALITHAITVIAAARVVLAVAPSHTPSLCGFSRQVHVPRHGGAVPA